MSRRDPIRRGIVWMFDVSVVDFRWRMVAQKSLQNNLCPASLSFAKAFLKLCKCERINSEAKKQVSLSSRTRGWSQRTVTTVAERLFCFFAILAYTLSIIRSPSPRPRKLCSSVNCILDRQKANTPLLPTQRRPPSTVSASSHPNPAPRRQRLRPLSPPCTPSSTGPRERSTIDWEDLERRREAMTGFAE